MTPRIQSAGGVGGGDCPLRPIGGLEYVDERGRRRRGDYRRVIVARDPDPERSDGGVLIPRVSQRRASFGTVLAVAPGSDLRVGERVAFHRNAGSDTAYKGTTYTIMPEADVLGVVEED